jgi:putative membrane protein
MLVAVAGREHNSTLKQKGIPMKQVMACMSLAALVGLFWLLPGGQAADDEKNPKDQKALTDEQFVKEASAGGLAEVSLGMLAGQRASNPAVRQFGQRMVQDHTRANRDLLRLADQKRWAVAREMDQKARELQDKLVRLQGADFDREYMEAMVKDHEHDASVFKDETKNAKDNDLRRWVDQTTPVIEEHLKLARQISDQIKGKEK